MSDEYAAFSIAVETEDTTYTPEDVVHCLIVHDGEDQSAVLHDLLSTLQAATDLWLANRLGQPVPEIEQLPLELRNLIFGGPEEDVDHYTCDERHCACSVPSHDHLCWNCEECAQ